MKTCRQISFNCYKNEKERAKSGSPFHIALACAHANNLVKSLLEDFPEIVDDDYSGLSDEEFAALNECLDYIVAVTSA